MRNVIGPPVGGDDFFNRVEELAKLRRLMEAGNHVLLVGPRRTGKSSLIAELARRLTLDGWCVVSVDVQDAADQAAFLDAILAGLESRGFKLPLMARVAKAIQDFRKFLRGIKGGVAGTSIEVTDAAVHWDEAAAPLKNLIVSLAGQNGRTLIAVDELPIFLTKILRSECGLHGVRQVLDWLRSVQQACGTRLPWVLCGSIGLDSFVEQHRLEGCINELLPQSIDAFDEATAVLLLQRLAQNAGYGFALSDEIALAMVARVGWPIPYYLQILFHALVELHNAKRSAAYPSLADVGAAYNELLSPYNHGLLSHWDSRLGDLLDIDQQRNVRLLLRHLCRLPDGCDQAGLLNLLAAEHPHADARELKNQLGRLLDFLERDGYLARRGDVYAFRSFLLRDFCRQRFAG